MYDRMNSSENCLIEKYFGISGYSALYTGAPEKFNGHIIVHFLRAADFSAPATN